MKINLLILCIIILTISSCKVKKLNDVLGNWSSYININLQDNSKEEGDYLYPSVKLDFKKVCKNNIHDFICKFSYDYGYEYFDKEEIINFSNNSKDIELLNKNQIVTKEFKYEKIKRIYLKPGEKFNFILHGVKIEAIINNLSYEVK